MNKVITINLGGNAYQLEEGGYDALRSYLDAAGRRLEGNPDRDEIIADIERAIADKVRGVLGANKTVVLAREVAAIIAEMGPVEDTADADTAAGTPESTPAAAPGTAGAKIPPRRLYKIREGAMVSGVCNGLAAYFRVDVTLVRLVFAFVTFFYGTGLLVYIILAIVIPSAETTEEKAAAQGTPAATAQEFIRRARAGYYEGMRTFGDRKAHREWRRRFKDEMRDWSRDFRQEMHQHANRWWQQGGPTWTPRSGAWFALPFLSLFLGLIAILGLWVGYTLITSGTVIGLPLPASMPVWVAILFLIVVIQAIRWPFKAMRRSYYCGGYGPPCCGPLGFLWHLCVWAAVIWFIYWLTQGGHSATLHDLAQHLPGKLHHALSSLKQWWEQL